MNGKMNIYYDEEGDFLEIMVGESREDYGEHLSEDVVLFKDIKTDEVIGIGIFNFKKRTKDLNDIQLNLPLNINLSAIQVQPSA